MTLLRHEQARYLVQHAKYMSFIPIMLKLQGEQPCRPGHCAGRCPYPMRPAVMPGLPIQKTALLQH